MNQLDLAGHILGYLRQHPKFPTARAAFVLACARNGAAGVTHFEFSKALNEPTNSIGGNLTRLIEAGIVEVVGNSTPRLYRPTAAGLELIAPLFPRNAAKEAAKAAGTIPTHA